MKIEIKEMPRASEGDSIELEGKLIRALKPNEGEYGWSQFIVVKDSTGEQGAWLKLDGEEDKVTKGSSIKIKGKVGKEYKDKQGKITRSINNCDFEVIGKMQAPAQSSAGQGNGKDDYWGEKLKLDIERHEWEKKKFIRSNRFIVVECSVKAAIEMVCAKTIKPIELYKTSKKITDHIYSCVKNLQLPTEKSEESEEKIKKEKIKKAREMVGDTEFKPASTKQKNIIFGYRDKEGWHKGMIESRYIEKHEIKEIGDPKKLSVEKASEWIEFWWGEQGNPDDIGARKQREIDNPRDENGKLVDALVKGDKTSLVKDVLIDDINELRRENFLNDDIKFEKELGYTPKLENLTEEELSKLKDVLKHYNPL